MSIGLLFVMSSCVVAAFLLLAIRVVGLRRVLRHATVIDVIFTVVICLALSGTLTGILIGILAGLLLTGVLSVLRYVQARVLGLRAYAAKTLRPVVIDDGWAPRDGWDRL